MNMPLREPIPIEPVGYVTRFLLKIAAVDLDTLRRCPRQDWDNARAVAEIQLFVWAYQTSLLSITAHRLFAAPDQFRPELFVGAAFIATFILLLDSYMVMRSGWHLSGIAELKRAGIDISGGTGARVKAGVFLSIRILLAIGFALISAIFLGILGFDKDIEAQLQENYRRANAPLIAQATALLDADLGRRETVLAAQEGRAAALASQLKAARDAELDPLSSDPRVKTARDEVAQLLARQAKAEEDLRNAEVFAANEAGGIKAAADNSGQVGEGPRYRAALEQAAGAKRRLQDATDALTSARTRLDAIAPRTATVPKDAKSGANEQRKLLEASLAAEDAKLKTMRDDLAALKGDREAAIRKAVESAPNHVARDDGLLAHIVVLERMARADTTIALVIGLIHLTSFGLELAAVLAKITSFVPTTYAARTASEAYLRAVRVAEELASELNDGPSPDTPDPAPLPPFPGPANDNQPTNSFPAVDPFGTFYAPPSKRPRGRPKNTMSP